MSKELAALESLIERFSIIIMNETNVPQTKDNISKCVGYTKQCFKDEINTLKSALERKEKLENVIRDLFNNHIELVIEDNGKSYYKIKGSKGKEKSFTSKHIAEGVLDLLKEMMK